MPHETEEQTLVRLEDAARLHGILAPLQRMELKLYMLQQQLGKNDTKAARHSSESLRSEIADIKRVIETYLNARLDSSTNLSPERLPRTDVQAAIQAIVTDLNELSARKNQKFVLRIEPGTVAVGRTDLDLAMSNVIHNAIKYGRLGTKIKIRGSRTGQMYAIDVVSYGDGIADDEADRIFEPGYRTQAAVQTEFTAAGLGLYASRHAISRWGGTLELTQSATSDSDDAELHRNTFTISVPTVE
ncbi:MAG: HAMP domain-containing sensor histidine kinase [Planctomycetota bacterium]|nr:HAMP domain-containing sensor histidine kinase [Planctomycetota bacterium]